MTFTIFF